MRTYTFMIGSTLCFASAYVYCAGAPVPDDVNRFIRHADNCEHLAGEWDSSLTKAEQREIQREVNRHCGGAQQQLKSLTVKYRDDLAARKILADHAYDSVMRFSAPHRHKPQDKPQ